MRKLLSLVDKLLICTFDYKEREDNIQPLSPKKWFIENLEFFYNITKTKAEKRKIMVGLPLYGNYFGIKGEKAITGDEFLDLMLQD